MIRRTLELIALLALVALGCGEATFEPTCTVDHPCEWPTAEPTWKPGCYCRGIGCPDPQCDDVSSMPERLTGDGPPPADPVFDR